MLRRKDRVKDLRSVHTMWENVYTGPADIVIADEDPSRSLGGRAVPIQTEKERTATTNKTGLSRFFSRSSLLSRRKAPKGQQPTTTSGRKQRRVPLFTPLDSVQEQEDSDSLFDNNDHYDPSTLMADIYRHRQFTSSTLSHKGSMISFLSLDDLPDLDESHSLYSLDEEINTPASTTSHFSFVDSFPMPPQQHQNQCSVYSPRSSTHTSNGGPSLRSPRIQNPLRLQRSNPEFTRPLRLKGSYSDLSRSNVVVHPASPLLLKGGATTRSIVHQRNLVNHSSPDAARAPERPWRDPRRLNTNSVQSLNDHHQPKAPTCTPSETQQPLVLRTHHQKSGSSSTDSSLSSSTTSSSERNRYLAVRKDDCTQLDHRVLSDSKSLQLSLMLLMMQRSRTESYSSTISTSSPKRRRPLFVYGHMTDPLLLSLILKVNPSQSNKATSQETSSSSPTTDTMWTPPRLSHGSRHTAVLSGFEKRVITSCNFTTIVKSDTATTDDSSLVEGILLYDLDVTQRRRIKSFYPKMPASDQSSTSSSSSSSEETASDPVLIDLFKRTTVEVVLSDGLALEADVFVWNSEEFGDDPRLVRQPGVIPKDGSCEWDAKSFKRKSLDTFLSVFGKDEAA